VRREYAKLPRIAREQLGMRAFLRALTFRDHQPGRTAGIGKRPLVDGIMSWSTFEHVQRDQLAPILRDLHACLRPGGYFFIQIEPLFYSPFGSHLRRYDDVPWHHLLATEAELWKIIQEHQGPIDASETDFGFADFGVDGYKKFVFNEYRALNRLTADELVEITTGVGFHVVRAGAPQGGDGDSSRLARQIPRRAAAKQRNLLVAGQVAVASAAACRSCGLLLLSINELHTLSFCGFPI
jgi:hypothetical protein